MEKTDKSSVLWDDAIVTLLQRDEPVCRATLNWVFRDAPQGISFDGEYQILPREVQDEDGKLVGDFVADLDECVLAEYDVATRRVHLEVQAMRLMDMAQRMLNYGIGYANKDSQVWVMPWQRVVCLREQKTQDPDELGLRLARPDGSLLMDYAVPVLYMDESTTGTLFEPIHVAYENRGDMNTIQLAVSNICRRIRDTQMQEWYGRKITSAIAGRKDLEVSAMKFDEQNPTVKRILGDVEAEGEAKARRNMIVKMYRAGHTLPEIEQLFEIKIADDDLLREMFEGLGVMKNGVPCAARGESTEANVDKMKLL